MIVQIISAVIQDFGEGNVLFIWSRAKSIIRVGSILWDKVYFALALHAVATTHNEHGLRRVLLQTIPLQEPPDSSYKVRRIFYTFQYFGPAARHVIGLPAQLASITRCIWKARDAFVLAQSNAQHSGMKIVPRWTVVRTRRTLAHVT